MNTVSLETKIREILALILAEYDWKISAEEMDNTPKRIVGMLNEWKQKREYNKITKFEEVKYNGMVVMKDIKFYALCSHHAMPFFGKINIGYIPNKLTLGASKLSRIVSRNAYQMTVQETMTQAIADDLRREGVKDFIIQVNAKHLCMRMRGIEDDETMGTELLSGRFKRAKVRAEFLSLTLHNGNGA